MSEWAQLREKLREFEADPVGTVAYLTDLRERCRKGIDQQKVMVSKEGSLVVDLLEKYPDIELKCTQEIAKTYQYVQKQVELEEAKDNTQDDQMVIFELHRYTGEGG